ncbi:MAG TPA: FG-GAP and VCBS repeat-containing protein, partial [Terriglobales bacterium]|nr:FG-GAP and VCBS repeat-containing protein [Terriglobales bacterium]
MRSILILLMFSAVVCSTVQALTWSKKTYSVPRANIERGDFNGDGRADLLLYGNGGTVVMLNAGDGTFDTTHISVTNQLTNVALLNFNRDGKLDVAGCDGSGNLLILLGGGDGTLTVSKTIADGCAWVTAADFNGDGNPDIAVGVPSPNADSSNNQVIV